MSNCTKCKKKIGMFSSLYGCDHEDCGIELCGKCNNIEDCKECGGTYCPKHIKDHECGGEEEEDTDLKEDIKEIQSMNEKQLLRMLVYLKIDDGNSDYFDNRYDKMIKKAKEEN